MSELKVDIQGRVGRLTLNRPKALNALTHAMAGQIETALDAWKSDARVAMIVIDAVGDKAFCAGGDVTDLYESGIAGDLEHGRRFWADEYRMNAKLHAFPKPVAAFMQGFTMGGGVGVGCHGSHRVVGDSSRIAMPEVAIGLVPDVGGSMLLANAPGRLGEYLGLTTERMGPGDAIHVGFADYYIPETDWPDLIDKLCETGDWTLIDAAAQPAPHAPLTDLAEIDALFAGEALSDILTMLRQSQLEFAEKTLAKISRHSPLAMGCAVEMIHRLRGTHDMARTLNLEYRFTSRAMGDGDFLEGVRALIIDKDRSPKWKHDLDALPPVDISNMLMPLPGGPLTFHQETPS